jgi:protein involved in polysaccharide export with SLBB domain
MTKDRLSPIHLGLLFLLPLASCTFMSQTGPQKWSIESKNPDYVLIPVKSRADLPAAASVVTDGQSPPVVKGNSYSDKIRTRDSIRFIITDLNEQSPFFGRGEPFQYGPLEVPEDGIVSVPYVGELHVLDRSLEKVSADLNQRLKPISNTAQASVSRTGRLPHTANVIGSVRKPGPVPLERDKISSMDLLSAAGGPVESEHLYNYTLRRNGKDYVYDFQNFRKRSFQVEEDDLLSVDPDVNKRFYILGAINKPTIVPFPVPAPTLADALAAGTGLDERRSDPSGVFVFRKGNPDEVYTINLKEPSAMLLTQRFPIRGEDMVYVTEAPLTRWNRLIMQILPISQSAYYLDRINNH